MKVVAKNLAAAFADLHEVWVPRVAGAINDMHLKIAKFEGEFLWHSHENEDELFWVIDGRLRLEFREQSPVIVMAGEFAIVPRGVEHRPVAEVPCQVVLLEPKSTVNTGNVECDRTLHSLKTI